MGGGEDRGRRRRLESGWPGGLMVGTTGRWGRGFGMPLDGLWAMLVVMGRRGLGMRLSGWDPW